MYVALTGKIANFLKLNCKPASRYLVRVSNVFLIRSNVTMIFVTVPNKNFRYKTVLKTTPPPPFNFPVLCIHHLLI